MNIDQSVIQMQNEAQRVWQGHWHGANVACTTVCPMGDPKSAAVFRRVLDQAIVGR